MPETLSHSPPLIQDVVTTKEKIGIFDKPTGPSKVKTVLSRNASNPLEGTRRLWYRVRRKKSAEKILVLARQNYKIFGDIEAMARLMSCVLSVL